MDEIGWQVTKSLIEHPVGSFQVSRRRRCRKVIFEISVTLNALREREERESETSGAKVMLPAQDKNENWSFIRLDSASGLGSAAQDGRVRDV